ncbi:CIS tube protein, partial [Actinoplanes subglobosus]
MTTLEKAVLEELDKAGEVVADSAVPVQFNPTSLKVQMSNSTDGAGSRGRQVQQYNGSASTTLSVQLEFDTADEGTTAEPVDVRGRTSAVARFILPGGSGSKQAPPRVQFRWGTIIVGGVMTSMSEDLTLFSGQGVPLRSAVSIDIRQQDRKFEALETGPGANPDTGAAPSGEPGTAAGPDNQTRGDRTAEALDGESAADFLARNGADPSAWRAIAGLLDDPLSLSAGLAVDFSASMSLSAGIGVSLGFAAELDVSAGVSLGLDAGGGGGGGGGNGGGAGLA